MASARDLGPVWLTCDCCLWISLESTHCEAAPEEDVELKDGRRCSVWRCRTCRLSVEDDPLRDHTDCFDFSIYGRCRFLLVAGPSRKIC